MLDQGFEEEKDLVEEDDTLKYFKPLMSRDRGQRNVFIDSLSKSLSLWHSRANDGDQIGTHLLNNHLPTAVRMTITCPFPDVRLRLVEILANIEVSNTHHHFHLLISIV